MTPEEFILNHHPDPDSLFTGVGERDDFLMKNITALMQGYAEMMESEDTKRLDFMQKQTKGYGTGWIFRDSVMGRGMRLHEHSGEGTSSSPREAIDKLMNKS